MLSKSGIEILWQHGLPCVPVVGPFVSPHIQFIPNIFIVQDLCKTTAGGRIFISATACQEVKVITASYLFERMMISEIRHVMHGTIEIYIIVKIAFCVFGKIINSTHSNNSTNDIR